MRAVAWSEVRRPKRPKAAIYGRQNEAGGEPLRITLEFIKAVVGIFVCRVLHGFGFCKGCGFSPALLAHANISIGV